MGTVTHLSIRITGRVQGVFYRASAHEKANEIGVCGFVRNERDGSVCLEAEGTTEQLQELVLWCKQGPARARVDQVEAIPGHVCGFTCFEIKG
jgi:acylphosphatase